ncbi:MAG: bacterial regulatory protein luxR family [Hyphomicrobiales bacterium]|nr:bacterial regulatory protein luxR family [Hyphomicrobiales bacterium]
MAETDKASRAIRHRGDLSAYLWQPTSGPLPLPPFHCRDVDLLYGVFTIDREAVEPFVPPELRIADSNLGCYAFYTVGAAFGLISYSQGFCAVVVDDHDSPDGSEGAFMLHSYVSGRAQEIIAELFDASAVPGKARVWSENGLYRASAGAIGHDFFGAAVRAKSGQLHQVDGTDLYLGRRRSGELVSYDISYSGTTLVAQTADYWIADDAPAVLKAARPVQHLYAQFLPGFSFGWGVPRPIGPAPAQEAFEGGRAFLELFSRSDRAALLVGNDGRIMHINPRARPLLGDDLAQGDALIKAFRPSERSELEAAMHHARSGTGRSVSQPVLLSRPDRPPIIAQATAVDPVIAGGGAVMVFLIDPSVSERGDATAALQLLGLTPAEARIAALVGRGYSPREASDALVITENTARSALRLIYSKLGIGRQSQLAKIVARLEAD